MDFDEKSDSPKFTSDDLSTIGFNEEEEYSDSEIGLFPEEEDVNLKKSSALNKMDEASFLQSLEDEKTTLSISVSEKREIDKTVLTENEKKFSKKIISFVKKIISIEEREKEIIEMGKILNSFKLSKIKNQKEERTSSSKPGLDKGGKPKFISDGPQNLNFEVFNQAIDASQNKYSSCYILIEVRDRLMEDRILMELSQELQKHGVLQDFSTFKGQSKRLEFTFRKSSDRGNFPFIICPVRNIEENYNKQVFQIVHLFSEMRKIFKPMLVFLNYWAYKRGILNYEYLPPMALSMMLVFFLQMCKVLPPIIDILYEKEKSSLKIANIKGKKYYHNDLKINNDPRHLKEIFSKLENPSSEETGRLVQQFFQFYSNSVINQHMAISPKTARLAKTIKPIEGIKILHPFLNQVNLAPRLIQNNDRFEAVKEEFQRGFHLLKDEKYDDLPQKYVKDFSK